MPSFTLSLYLQGVYRNVRDMISLNHKRNTNRQDLIPMSPMSTIKFLSAVTFYRLWWVFSCKIFFCRLH